MKTKNTTIAKRTKVAKWVNSPGFSCWSNNSKDPNDWGFEVNRQGISALIGKYIPVLSDAPWSIDAKPDRNGLTVAVVAIELTPELALALLARNRSNRQFNWGHAARLAETLRLDGESPDSFEDFGSQILAGLWIEPDGSLSLRIVDGQHRLVAVILANGTWEQIQIARHYIGIAEARRAGNNVDPDTVYIPKGPKPDDGEDEYTLGEWLAMLQTPHDAFGQPSQDEGAILANSPLSYDIPVKWEISDGTVKRDPVRFVLVAGCHPKIYSRIDQNARQRTGGDELSTDPEVSNAIASAGLNFDLAASVLADIGKRCRRRPKLDDQGKETNGYTLGSLKDGGRWAAPPKFPAWWRVLGGPILDAWQSWDSVGDLRDSNETGNFANKDSEAYAAFVVANNPFSSGGRKIPDQRALVALSLAAHSGRFDESELDDLALRLRFGVALADDGSGTTFYVPDEYFNFAREVIAEYGRLKVAAHPDELTDAIVDGMLSYIGDTSETHRLPGLDREGINEEQEARASGKVPGRKRGRPAGSKNKK